MVAHNLPGITDTTWSSSGLTRFLVHDCTTYITILMKAFHGHTHLAGLTLASRRSPEEAEYTRPKLEEHPETDDKLTEL